jgi:hypothetical protein
VAAVAQRAPGGTHRPIERRLTRAQPRPQRIEHLLPVHQAVSVADQVRQERERARLDRDAPPIPVKPELRVVELETFE